jgi:uncharacterized protein YukE
LSALDGFYATWNSARQQFGEGTPQGGAQVDASAQLNQLSSDVQAAAPGDSWTGDASDAYGAANTKHGETFSKLAGLDKRLAAQLDQAVEVNSAGRQNLDNVRQWVTDAVNSVPPGKQRDTLLMQIASKGLGQVSDIVQTSNDANNGIRDNLNGLKPEFEAISYGGELKEAPAENKLNDDGMSPTEKIQAEQDVRALLSGDKDAAARAAEVLKGIEPGRELSPRESSYLSQLQAQQYGMTVDDITTAEGNLGEYRGVLSNSWQLMSNDDVYFSRTPTNQGPGALDAGDRKAGGFDQLPQSFQQNLNREGIDSFPDRLFDPMSDRIENANNVAAIADMVSHGDKTLQQGTKLDDALLDWSRETLHYEPSVVGSLSIGDKIDDYCVASDNALADVFNAAGRDHQAVSAELASSTGQQFLTDLHTHAWADTDQTAANQQSTHSLLAWIGDEARSTNPEIADRAGQAAQALATNLSDKHDLYINPDSAFGASPSTANLNPALIAADAVALEPYQEALVGQPGMPGFDAPGEPENGDLKAARNIFAVIDSDHNTNAAASFNAAAQEKVLAHQQAFAEAAAEKPIADTPEGDLRRAGYLLGVINGGAEEAAIQHGLQAEQQQKAIYDIKKAGLDFLLGDQLPATDRVPGYELSRDTLETAILGSNPDGKVEPEFFPEYSSEHGIRATYFQVAQSVGITPEAPEIPAQFFDGDRLKPPDQIPQDQLGIYSTSLQNYLAQRGFDSLGGNFDQFYEDGAGK